jgi:tetratricopeptide (TPR) repeat protein
MGGEFVRGGELVREALAELGDDPRFTLSRVSCLQRASQIARESGELTVALDRALEAQRLLRESGQASALRELSTAMNVAEAYRMAGKPRDAAAAFETAFAQLTALGRDDTEKAGTLLNNWALAVRETGRPIEAERLFRRAVAISSEDTEGPGVSPMLLNNLAWVLFDLNQLDEAAGISERAYEKARSAGNEVVTSQSLMLRSYIYREQGKIERAAGMLDELEPRWRSTMPENYIGFAVIASQRSAQALALGDGRKALEAAEQAIALAKAGEDANFLPTLLVERAKVHLFLGNLAQAHADADEAINSRRSMTEAGSPSAALGRGYLVMARVLAGENKPAESREAYAVALKNFEPTLGPDHPATREARTGAAAP